VSDGDVRLFIYRCFMDSGAPPSVADAAAELGVTEDEAEAAYRRLESDRAIVLAPGTANVWMANPFSSVPTPFRVHTDAGSFWGSCIWDALGIPAMLNADGRVETWCADCMEPMTLTVADGELEQADGVAHFAVPASQWWDNIGYT
jgi:hypothetical protein